VLEWLWFLNSHRQPVSEWMWGDKDTYRLAFALAGKPDAFQQVSHPCGPCNVALLYHTENGKQQRLCPCKEMLRDARDQV